MIRVVRDIKGPIGFVQIQRSICRNFIQHSETVSPNTLEMLLSLLEKVFFLHQVYHVAPSFYTTLNGITRLSTGEIFQRGERSGPGESRGSQSATSPLGEITPSRLFKERSPL